VRRGLTPFPDTSVRFGLLFRDDLAGLFAGDFFGATFAGDLAGDFLGLVFAGDLARDLTELALGGGSFLSVGFISSSTGIQKTSGFFTS
jgi:hypothetical protein